MKEMISLSAASYFVGFSDTVNSYDRDSKMAAHFDVFCELDLKFSIDHKKLFFAANSLVFYCFFRADIL